MRVLLSGAVGAAASAAAWLALEHYTKTNLGWLVCLVGLVTGISVHRASATRAAGGIGRGAIAVVLTLAAIFVGRLVYAKIMQANSNSASPAPVLIAKDKADDSSTGEKGDADASAAPQRIDLPDERANLSAGAYSNRKVNSSFSNLDMIWMCLAALGAYITGKGSDSVDSVSLDTAEEQSKAPASDSGDPAVGDGADLEE